MSYHDAMRRIAYDDDMYGDDDTCPGCGLEDCECAEDEWDGTGGDDDVDDSDEGRLRQQITDAMPEGDPEAYMASGRELLDELLANPDRGKLSLILDKEIEELQALLGDTDIDLQGLKETALSAFDAAIEAGGPSRGAVMSAMAAIREAGARALRGLGLMK